MILFTSTRIKLNLHGIFELVYYKFSTMKKILWAALLHSLLPPFSWSQGQKLKLAVKEYSSYDYSEAAGRFEKMQKSDIALRSLGDSYYKMQQYAKSELAYSQLVTSPSAVPADISNYISVLLINEKYAEALQWMEKFSSTYPSDERYAAYLSEKNVFENLKRDAGQFVIRNLDINSEQEDFGAVFYRDSVVLTSSREEAKPVKRTWNGNKLPYLDLYFASMDSQAELKNLKRIYSKVNKKYHEGPASFTRNGSVMAFTRNNYESKSSDGVRKLQLFISKAKNDTLPSGQILHGWTKPEGVPFNSHEYSVGQPAFNDDGSALYFASDMPGGKGGTDLYKADRNPDGTWGKPQSLGDKINTPGDEMFPFFHSSGLLFFSSTGHKGLGGLDVFVAKMNDTEIGQIKNVGIPVNSSKDDLSFVLANNMRFGYFASNREGGKGNDDIYSYQLMKPFNFGKIAGGTVKNKEGTALAYATVVLRDENGKEIKSGTSDSNGKFLFELNEEKPSSLFCSLKNYTDARETFNEDMPDQTNIDLILEHAPAISILCVIRDKKNTRPLGGAKISVTDNVTGKELISFISDSTEDKRIPITDKKEGSPYNYVFKIEKEGYLSRSIALKGILKTGEISMSETVDKIEIGTDLGKILNIKPIYFNLGKSDIRKDAAGELERVIQVMNENSTMVIELGSHTDCRGTAASNLSLSDKRAKSSASYIKGKISNPDRIYGKGYGESKPVNGCLCEDAVKSSCSEEEHQKNRRTEFKIIKM